MCADWFKTIFLSLNRNKELAKAIDTMMQAKRRELTFKIFDHQSKQVDFFWHHGFSKRNRKLRRTQKVLFS